MIFRPDRTSRWWLTEHLLLIAYVLPNVTCLSTTSVLDGWKHIGMRIVNGQRVDIVDFPFQVSIEHKNRHICGGAIIGQSWVVSARHCFTAGSSRSEINAAEYGVRVGSSHRAWGGTVQEVDNIYIHPGPGAFDYDVSVLHTAKPFEYSQKIRPIALPPKLKNTVYPEDDTKLIVSGYGAVSQRGQMSPELLKADLKIVEKRECAKHFRRKAQVKITDRMLCAVGITQDACQGDSGGPLTTGATLVGVVSFGLGCAVRGVPGVYANLANTDIRAFIFNKTGL